MLDDISTGASGDISTASKIARAMIMEYGMSDVIGPIAFNSGSHEIFIGRDMANTKTYSEKTAAAIDDEVHALFERAQNRCREILDAHRNLLVATAEYLLQYETMDGETFRSMLENDGVLPLPAPKEETEQPEEKKPESKQESSEEPSEETEA